MAISVALLSSASWGHAAITDASGKLTIIGEDYWTYGDHFYDTTLGRSSRLIWDGSRAHFQAGSGIKGSSSVGDESFAFGNSAWSQGYGSFAFGNSVHSAGLRSFAFGASATANNNYSFAFGNQVSTSGNHSFVFGDSSTSYGGVVFGKQGWAITNALSSGRQNSAGGYYSVAMGYGNSVSSFYAAAIGSYNTVSGTGSIALGQLNQIVFDEYMVNGGGDGAGFAIGQGLNVGNADALAVGRFNVRAGSWNDGYLFVVGNGTSGSNRSDAFSVDANGNVWAAGTITSTGSLMGSSLESTSELKAGGLDVFTHSRTAHLEGDGALYRLGSQVYLTVDDNFYIRDMGGSNKFHFQTDNGRLGINKTSPGYPLDVNGDVRATNFRLTGGNVISNAAVSTWNTAYGWGDHGSAGYLTTETDPTYAASPSASITSLDLNSWNAAYSWGNHAAAGYLTTFAETDPLFSSSPLSAVTVADLTSWNTAYAWGDHSEAGYYSSASPEVVFPDAQVGIGTSTPSASLDVAGTVRVGGTGSNINHTNVSNAWFKVGTNLGMDNNEIYFSGVHGTVGTLTNHYVSIRTNKAERLRITGAGNVRIGAGDPTGGYKLDVGGSLRVDGSAQVQNNLAIGGDAQIAGDVSVAGKVTLVRHGDVYMGEFGQGADMAPPSL